MVGTFSTVPATSSVIHVKRGPTQALSAVVWGQTWSVFTAKRKTFSYNISTMVIEHGLVWMTSPLKVSLPGSMDVRISSDSGPQTNPTTWKGIRIVFTHLALTRVIRGMTWIVQRVTATRVRKVTWVTIKGPLGLTSGFVKRGEKAVQCMLVKCSCKAAWLKTSLAKQAG